MSRVSYSTSRAWSTTPRPDEQRHGRRHLARVCFAGLACRPLARRSGDPGGRSPLPTPSADVERAGDHPETRGKRAGRGRLDPSSRVAVDSRSLWRRLAGAVLAQHRCRVASTSQVLRRPQNSGRAGWRRAVGHGRRCLRRGLPVPGTTVVAETRCGLSRGERGRRESSVPAARGPRG
jgi:hypothetical protein